MQMDRFTIKAQEALQAAQQLAQERSHQQLDAEHLALALIGQQDSLIPQLLQRLGAPVPQMTAEIGAELDRHAKVQGATQVYPTQELQAALAAAESEAKKLHDEYVSTEHLLLGLVEKGGAKLTALFNKHGVRRDAA